MKVAGIYESGANPASEISMVMPLADLQRLVGEEGKINEVLITHGGPAVEGGGHTDATVDEIRPVLTSNDLEADPVKKDAIDRADSQGEIFSTLFVLFGQFSVAAGMLLIFLIFVMLAAERKHELGIARAVGMQRSNLIRAFAFEGVLYAFVAGAIGSVAGVGVGWVMVRLLGQGFAGGSEGFRIIFSTSVQNVILAFCMGMVLTFAVVLLSSWRVSRLNVVRAIRDIPEPDKRGRGVWGIVVAVLTPIAGAVSFWQGFATETVAFYLGGLSLMIIGLALLARVLGLPDRLAFSASGFSCSRCGSPPPPSPRRRGWRGVRRCSSSPASPSSSRASGSSSSTPTCSCGWSWGRSEGSRDFPGPKDGGEVPDPEPLQDRDDAGDVHARGLHPDRHELHPGVDGRGLRRHAGALGWVRDPGRRRLRRPHPRYGGRAPGRHRRG